MPGYILTVRAYIGPIDGKLIVGAGGWGTFVLPLTDRGIRYVFDISYLARVDRIRRS